MQPAAGPLLFNNNPELVWVLLVLVTLKDVRAAADYTPHHRAGALGVEMKAPDLGEDAQVRPMNPWQLMGYRKLLSPTRRSHSLIVRAILRSSSRTSGGG